MRKVALLAAVAVLSVSAFAQKKPIKSLAALTLTSGQTCQFQCNAGRFWSLPGPRGSTSTLYTGVIGDINKDGYAEMLDLANAAISVSGGENPLFEGSLTFVDMNNNPAAKVNLYQCWPSKYKAPSLNEISQGHGLSVEISSSIPIDLSPLSTFRVWDSRSQVWNALKCSVDGLDTSEVVDISSFTMDIADPKLSAAGLLPPVTYSHVQTEFKTKNTNITDVYLMEASGKLTHMTMNYSSTDGHTLTVDLGTVKVASVTNSLLDPSSYSVDYEVDGPVSWKYQ